MPLKDTLHLPLWSTRYWGSTAFPCFRSTDLVLTCLFSSDKNSGQDWSRTPAILPPARFLDFLAPPLEMVPVFSRLISTQTFNWLPLGLRLKCPPLQLRAGMQRGLAYVHMFKPRFFIRLIIHLNQFLTIAIPYLLCLAGVLGPRVTYSSVPCGGLVCECRCNRGHSEVLVPWCGKVNCSKHRGSSFSLLAVFFSREGY